MVMLGRMLICLCTLLELLWCFSMSVHVSVGMCLIIMVA